MTEELELKADGIIEFFKFFIAERRRQGLEKPDEKGIDYSKDLMPYFDLMMKDDIGPWLENEEDSFIKEISAVITTPEGDIIPDNPELIICQICGDEGHSSKQCPHRLSLGIKIADALIVRICFVDLAEKSVIRIYETKSEQARSDIDICYEEMHTLMIKNVIDKISMELAKKDTLFKGRRGKRHNYTDDKMRDAVIGYYKQDPFTRPTKEEYLSELFGEESGTPKVPVSTYNDWVAYIKEKYKLVME